MKKDLPKVYANTIDKVIKNNKKIYMTDQKEKTSIKEQENIKNITTEQNKKSIDEQIKMILNTKKYIYKIPVEIETEKEIIITKIIGKNKNNLITIDNELIKIDTIKNIKIKNE